MAIKKEILFFVSLSVVAVVVLLILAISPEKKEVEPTFVSTISRKERADMSIRRMMKDSRLLGHENDCNPVRFGSGNGAHALCNFHPATPCRFYSFGISSDYSFDVDVSVKMKCTGIALDPTVDYPDELTPGVKFLKLGAKVKGALPPNIDDPSAPTEWDSISVTELMKKYRDTNLAVLKMDCEGCEFALADDIIENDPTLFERVDQFAFEIHLPTTFMPTDEHHIALGELFSLLYYSGHVLIKHEINGCNPRHEDSGCHRHLVELNYPCARGQMCQNILFARIHHKNQQ